MQEFGYFERDGNRGLIFKVQVIRTCRYGMKPETEIILSLKVLKFVLDLDLNVSWP